jgi:hypothetical protein
MTKFKFLSEVSPGSVRCEFHYPNGPSCFRTEQIDPEEPFAILRERDELRIKIKEMEDMWTGSIFQRQMGHLIGERDLAIKCAGEYQERAYEFRQALRKARDFIDDKDVRSSDQSWREIAAQATIDSVLAKYSKDYE